jgi:TetR/AcrR family transcriptional regulator
VRRKSVKTTSAGKATRQDILDKAELHFAAVGFDAARLEDVASDVGIRRPSLLYHFPTKQALYDEVEAGIFAGMHAAGQQAIATGADPFERLLRLLDAWLDFLVARPSAARIIMRLTSDYPIRREDPVRFSNQVLDDVDEVIESGVASGAFAPISSVMAVNTLAGAALFYVCNPEQVGKHRRYRPNDPAELAVFRALLHRMAAAVVLPRGTDRSTLAAQAKPPVLTEG